MAIKVVSVSPYDDHCSRQREQLPSQTVCRLEADIFRSSSWYRRRCFTSQVGYHLELMVSKFISDCSRWDFLKEDD